VIPHWLLEQVTVRVTAWSQSESKARSEIIDGLPLLAALEKYGHL
jgi:hypothetical protein